MRQCVDKLYQGFRFLWGFRLLVFGLLVAIALRTVAAFRVQGFQR